MIELRPPTIDERIRRYEGLVRKTAGMVVKGQVEHDFDDLCSLFRIKVWQALESFDPARHLTEESYVFMCVANLKKDIGGKKNRRGNERYRDTRGREISFDSLTHQEEGHDRFDHPALRVDPEQIFAEIEGGDAFLPNTLGEAERRVVVHLYAGYNQTEIAQVLGLTGREMEKTIKSVRAKMADWKPSGAPAVREPATV